MGAATRIAIPVPTSTDREYNRRSWPMYAAAVREAGGIPVEVDLRLSSAEVAQVARGCEGILLPGSPADVDPLMYGQERMPECAQADRARETVDRLLLEEAYLKGKPLLGICYGLQSLNVWRGGTLVQDLPCRPVNHAAGAAVAVAHTALIERRGVAGELIAAVAEGSLQAGAFRLPVNSSHHQAVSRVGDGLEVVALSAEDGVIEGVQGVGGESPAFVLGVQWHPERSAAITAFSREIFCCFVQATRLAESAVAKARTR